MVFRAPLVIGYDALMLLVRHDLSDPNGIGNICISNPLLVAIFARRSYIEFSFSCSIIGFVGIVLSIEFISAVTFAVLIAQIACERCRTLAIIECIIGIMSMVL